MTDNTYFSFDPHTIKELSSNFDLHKGPYDPPTTESDTGSINNQEEIIVNGIIGNDPIRTVAQTPASDSNKQKETTSKQSQYEEVAINNAQQLSSNSTDYPPTTESDSYTSANTSNPSNLVSETTSIASSDTTNTTMTEQPIETIAQTQKSDADDEEEMTSNQSQNDTEAEAINNVQNDNDHYNEERTTANSTIKHRVGRLPYSSRDGRVMFCGYHGSMIGCRKGTKCALSHLNAKLVPLCEDGKDCKSGMKCEYRHYEIISPE